VSTRLVLLILLEFSVKYSARTPTVQLRISLSFRSLLLFLLLFASQADGRAGQLFPSFHQHSHPLRSRNCSPSGWLGIAVNVCGRGFNCSAPPAVLCALTLALVAAALASAASTAPGEPSRETDDVRAETSDCFWGCGSAAGGAEQSTVRGAQAQQLRTVGRNGLQAETYTRKKNI